MHHNNRTAKDGSPLPPAFLTREYRPGETKGEAGIDVPDHQPEQAEAIHQNRLHEPVPMPRTAMPDPKPRSCRELQ